MTTVREEMGMCCPNCLDDDGLTVTFTGECAILPNGSEDVGSHEWDSSSACWCDCGWSGIVAETKHAHNEARRAESFGWEWDDVGKAWHKADETSPDGYRHAATVDQALSQDADAIAWRALNDAERFISGFEDDKTQEGIADLLSRIRTAQTTMMERVTQK